MVFVHTVFIVFLLGLFCLTHQSLKGEETGLKVDTVMCKQETCTGTIIFLHGSGASGEEMKELNRKALGRELTFQSLKIIYPTAPLQKYSGNQGKLRRIWFDRLKLQQSSPEIIDSIDRMAPLLIQIIDEEMRSGISANRIVIGGYSMGGGMSLHIGLRYCSNLAGIFGLSSFLNDGSMVYETLKEKKYPHLPDVFFGHGDADPDVPAEWAKETRRQLTALGVNSTYHEFKNLSHVVSGEELLLLEDWIRNIVEEMEY